MTAAPFPAAAIAAARSAIEAHLRIETDTESATIETLAATALDLCERFAGMAILRREHIETLAGTRRWARLIAAPVVAITEVAALDIDGGATPLGADRYTIDIDAAGHGWIRVTDGAADRVAVTCQAGLVERWADLPPPIMQGVLLLAAHLFEARSGDTMPPAAVSALWRPWRRLTLRRPEHVA